MLKRASTCAEILEQMRDGTILESRYSEHFSGHWLLTTPRIRCPQHIVNPLIESGSIQLFETTDKGWKRYRLQQTETK